jgi:hypothetical protein
MSKQIDPYRILGIPYTADEETIRNAFLKKMSESKDSSIIVNAYALIRDEEARRRFKWGNMWSCLNLEEIAEGLIEKKMPQIELESLIKELAFQSEWELGDDSCLKTKLN